MLKYTILLSALLLYTASSTNCEGSWGEWSECDVVCGEGHQARVFSVNVPQQDEGSSCEFDDGEQQVQHCDAGECCRTTSKLCETDDQCCDDMQCFESKEDGVFRCKAKCPRNWLCWSPPCRGDSKKCVDDSDCCDGYSCYAKNDKVSQCKAHCPNGWPCRDVCPDEFHTAEALYCDGACGDDWIDAVHGCQQADADAYCKLKHCDPLAYALSFEVGVASDTVGFACDGVGADYGDMLGMTDVHFDENLLASHGAGQVVENVECGTESSCLKKNKKCQTDLDCCDDLGCYETKTEGVFKCKPKCPKSWLCYVPPCKPANKKCESDNDCCDGLSCFERKPDVFKCKDTCPKAWSCFDEPDDCDAGDSVHVDTYGGFEYFKVPVSGPMSDNNVLEACHSYGMVPMCSGPDGCGYNDDLCTVTPLSTSCGNPMQGLSQRICEGNNPNSCDMTTDLYNYMGNNWQSGSSCGTDGSSWCTIGNHRNDHDALCVREEGSCGDHDVDCIGHWDDWTECSHDCDGGQQTRTFHVTVEAQGEGTQCAHADHDVETQDCNQHECDDCDIGDAEFLVTHGGFDHFAVPVSGSMSDTNVRNACNGYGMVPMCSGPDGCSFNDNNCLVSSLSTSCHNPMQGLSQLLCSGNNPNSCEHTTHLYNYMGENWNSGASCGTDGSGWCTNGNQHSDRNALCIRVEGECGSPDVNCEGHWDDWTECNASCDGGQQTRTFHVTVPAQGEGTQCAHADDEVETQDCNTQVCDNCDIGDAQHLETFGGFDYYKVPVSGSMSDTNVQNTCNSYGMRPMCSGPDGCNYNDDHCDVTPLSTSCGNPMQGLSQRICNGNNPNSCEQTTDLYNYMGQVWQSGSSCGTDGSSWCTIGNHQTNRFALCVRTEGECGEDNNGGDGGDNCDVGDSEHLSTYGGFDYFNVPVSGTMTDINIREACHDLGMVPMCSGPDGCTFNDDQCSVTPLSTSCYNPMQGLSQHLCDGSNPSSCDQTTHLYNYMGENWGGGGCGTDGSSWCTNGNSHTDRGALCVRAETECGGQDVACVGHWEDWSDCSVECNGGQQTRTFHVTTPAQGNGAQCAHADDEVQTQDCNTQSCGNCETGNSNHILTHNGWNFYKVPINGAMTDTSIRNACVALGMIPMCSGPDGCMFNDDQCQVTSLSTSCYNPLQGLSQHMCGGSNPPQCSYTHYLFSYMGENWQSGSSCGTDGSSWCVVGNNDHDHDGLCVRSSDQC